MHDVINNKCMRLIYEEVVVTSLALYLDSIKSKIQNAEIQAGEAGALGFQGLGLKAQDFQGSKVCSHSARG